MACRSLERANKALDKMQKSLNSKGNVIIRELDLSSLKSVREFADQINKEEKCIDILVNNGGMISKDKSLTEDGFELHFGVNYLSHFLLTRLLFDKLRKSKNGKIINVSSDAHYG